MDGKAGEEDKLQILKALEEKNEDERAWYFHNYPDSMRCKTEQGDPTTVLAISLLKDTKPAAQDLIVNVSEWTFSYVEKAYSEVFGPKRRNLHVDSAWLARHGETARRLARSIYNERLWKTMPVLADALEDGRCDNTDFLAHLRGPGPHFRGC